MRTPGLPLANRSTAPVLAASRTRDELAIQLAVLLVVASVYIWSLSASPELRTPTRLVLLSGLMLLHASLLVIGPRLWPRRRWLPIYFAVQGALAFSINQMTSLTGAAYGWYLYLGLAAQAVGLLNHRSRLAALVAGGYLALALIHHVWMWGWSPLPAFLLRAAPQTFFVIAFVILFFRQVRVRQRSQVLLNQLEMAHQDLESAHRQLADYAARVEDLTLLNERQRLARELHDTLAQGLAGLILQLEAVDKQLAHARVERAQDIVQQAMGRARLTLTDARRAIDDLRLGEPTSGSLAEAVRLEADRFTAATGIPCEVELAPPSLISNALRDHVFRAVTEGLTNVARHAHARHAWVRLAEADGGLEIEVRDDGVGFDPTVARSRHYGLVGLRERAQLVGGSLDVKSALGQGTTITLRLPIKENNHV